MTDAQFHEITTLLLVGNELLAEILAAQRGVIGVVLEEVPAQAPAAAPAEPCTHPLELRTDSHPRARFWKCQAPGCGYIYDSEHVKTGTTGE